MSNIDKWDIKKLVAQVVMPKLSVATYLQDEKYNNQIKQLIEAGIGGFCVFNASIDNLPGVVGELQSLADIPLMFSCDMEFGVAMRIEGATGFPHAMAHGKTGEVKMTIASAQLIAREAKELGIRWNFAPVADINSNKANPVINIRAFGEDIFTVSQHVQAYIKATQSENVIACAKHFPGHGDTHVDSHTSLPVLEHSLERIIDFELVPFTKAINAGVRSIMLGHLAVPAIDDSMLPASISEKTVRFLRENLKYDGFIITDALDMKAITNICPQGTESVKAIKAGSNIALMPENPFAALEALRIEAETDSSFVDKLKFSAKKMYNEKRWCGLIPQKPEELGIDRSKFIQYEKIALSIAQQSLEVNAKKIIIPIKPEAQIAGFAFLQREEDFAPASTFFKFLAQAIDNDIDFGYIDESISDADIRALREGLVNTDLFIFTYFYKGRAGNSDNGNSSLIDSIVKKICNGKERINVFFGNPYIAEKVEGDLAIKTYSDSLASLAAVVMTLAGRNNAGL